MQFFSFSGVPSFLSGSSNGPECQGKGETIVAKGTCKVPRELPDPKTGILKY